MTTSKLYQLFTSCNSFTTDTRKIKKGSMFFALKGENFNGNSFAEEAIQKGAKYAIIDEEKYQTKENIILVKNVLSTLQKLASFHRKKLNIPIIALTGSNGKTTTKELINAVLKTTFNTSATQGNLNNHIGVPLTLLSMTKKTEIGIVEMGANHLNEIKALCNIAQPNYGYITSFGKAHLEGFGSFDGVIKGKTELYKFLEKNNGKVFINKEDKLQLENSKNNTTIGFSQKEVKLISTMPFVSVKFKEAIINSNLFGFYNYSNIMAAICIGNYFNISTEKIAFGIENYTPNNNRSQQIKKGTNMFFLDAYNANPTSMTLALKNFNSLEKKNKIIFLGDMFEVGATSLTEHQKIADLVATMNFKKVYLIGETFFKTKTENAVKFKSFEDFKNAKLNLTFNHSGILIKASRGMALERILDFI